MKNIAPSTQLFKFKIILLKRGKSSIIWLFPVAALTKTNNIAITSSQDEFATWAALMFLN